VAIGLAAIILILEVAHYIQRYNVDLGMAINTAT